jgi:hypothetical protein
MVMLSGRDCFLWNELYQTLYPMLATAPPAGYFYSSRLTRMEPSADYLAYFRALRGDGRSVLVDIAGTGWSLTRLIEQGAAENVDIFLVHHVDLPEVTQRYESFAPTNGSVTPISIFHRRVAHDENEVLEELNRAPHPMLAGMRATTTGFRPIFISDGAAPSASAARLLETHHGAFRACIRLVGSLDARAINQLRQYATNHCMNELYRRFEGLMPQLSQFAAEKAYEEEIFSALLRNIRTTLPAIAD